MVWPPFYPQSPSPGLAPAVAANTTVFVLGINVLLKGLTWPGVINSWFLGTVRLWAYIYSMLFVIGVGRGRQNF